MIEYVDTDKKTVRDQLTINGNLVVLDMKKEVAKMLKLDFRDIVLKNKNVELTDK